MSMSGIRKSKGEIIFGLANTVFLSFMIMITLYPFLYVAFASVSDPRLMMQHTGILVKPLGFSFSAYKLVINNPMIIQGYKNTIVYVTLGTCLNLILTTLGAYVLSRKSFLFRDVLMMAIVFTMFLKGGIIPTYLIVKSLGMFDSMSSVIIPSAINTFNLIIMRTSFLAIPASFEESAKIDGANDFAILFKIIIPLSMPVIAVMILFYGVHNWNAWFNAMLYLRSRIKYPLQLILREIIISSDTSSMSTEVLSDDIEPVGEIIKYATIMIATVPILMIYPFLQRFFIKGVMVGGIKG